MRTLLLPLALLVLPTLAHALAPRLTLFELQASVSEVSQRDRREGTWFGAMAVLHVSFDTRARVAPRALAEPAQTRLRIPGLSPALVRRTLHAAYRAAGLGVSDRSVSSALTRGRVAALLPEVTLRGAQYTGLDSILYDPNSRGSNRDQLRDTRTLEAKLGWRLDRLIYGPDEPQLERIRSQRVELKLRITHQVMEALTLRHRALFDLKRVDPASVEAEEAALKLSEAEALLDALTDGEFRRASCAEACE